jgi:predicted TIM-barrel fold metal-dependent hydrolase
MSRFHSGHSRREFVKTALTAGAGALLPAVNAAGQDRRQGRIDVHHHCRTAVQGGAGRGPGSDWSPDKSIEQMDKFGIATSIISATVPAEPFYDGTEKSRTVARGVNDFIAKMMVDHPGRFGLFAAIPMPDIDGTLREIEYAFDTLHADGIGIFSSVRDKYPGDPVFAPIWRELNRRKAIVFIHPTFPSCCGNVVPGVGAQMVEFDFDTTRAVVSLLVNGVLSSFPDLRIIVNHSGAAIPTLAGRIKDRMPAGTETTVPKGAIFELQRLYYEVAHATYPYPMAALRSFAPSTHILFGTDYPLEPIESTHHEMAKLRLRSDLQRAIDRTNAERLIPRLRGRSDLASGIPRGADYAHRRCTRAFGRGAGADERRSHRRAPSFRVAGVHRDDAREADAGFSGMAVLHPCQGNRRHGPGKCRVVPALDHHTGNLVRRSSGDETPRATGKRVRRPSRR